MGLGRMLVSLGGLLVAFVVFTLLMMLRGGAVRPCSILVVFSSSRMGILRHSLLQCDKVAKEKHLNRGEVSADHKFCQAAGDRYRIAHDIVWCPASAFPIAQFDDDSWSGLDHPGFEGAIVGSPKGPPKN
jgi:hypothetical protein